MPIDVDVHSIARRFRPVVKEPVPGPKGQGFDPRRRSPSRTVPTVHGCDRSAPRAVRYGECSIVRILYGRCRQNTVNCMDAVGRMQSIVWTLSAECTQLYCISNRYLRTGRYSILSLVISGHSLFDLYSEWEKVLVRLKITGQSILNSALYPQSYPRLHPVPGSGTCTELQSWPVAR